MATKPNPKCMATEACYTPQRIPHYQGNPFIEALPPPLEDDALLASIFSVPAFSPEQREWSKSERMQMIAQLGNFMAPMDRHLRLAQSIDTLLRQGYVGRAPNTVESHRVERHIYDNQKQGMSFSTGATSLTSQLSSALIGLPGMGKTCTIRRVLARHPSVIFHRDHDIYQIPYLHIEMPYDGASVKGIATSIFRKVDKLLPGADYSLQYGNQKAGAETMMNWAALVLHRHAVGILVVDEVQNLENSPKNHQSLMSLLVSASNELGIPILFVGTNKAAHLLQGDFRQARRSSGLATNYWGAMQCGTEEAPGEWEDFMFVLWKFQWVKQPVPLNGPLSDLMYRHSQGITDIAIKLFAIAQTRAIFDGSEMITGALIDDVARKEMALVQPMLEAIRRNDEKALSMYRDISPVRLDSMLHGVATSFSGRTVAGATIGGDSPQFRPMLTEVFTRVGFAAEDAETMADQAADAKNVLEGVQQGLKHATSGKRVKREKASEEAAVIAFEPGDFRAASQAGKKGESVAARMQAMHMLATVDTLLAL